MNEATRRLLALATVVAFASAAPVAMAKPTDPKAIDQGKRGNELYADGDYEGAKDAYEAAYAIEADVVFLYGVGQALNQLGDCRGAIRKYKQVKESPSAAPEIRQLAEQAMLACAEKVATEDPEGDSEGDDSDAEPEPEDLEPDEGITGTESVGEDEEPAKTRKWYLDPLGDTLVALGIVGAGAGTGLLVAAQLEQAKDSASYQEFDERRAKTRTFRIAGAVTLGVGGALLIGGVIRWTVLGLRPKAKSNAQVGVLYDGTSAGLSLSGRF